MQALKCNEINAKVFFIKRTEAKYTYMKFGTCQRQRQSGREERSIGASRVLGRKEGNANERGDDNVMV